MDCCSWTTWKLACLHLDSVLHAQAIHNRFAYLSQMWLLEMTLNILGGPFKKRKEKKSFHLIYCKRSHLNKGELCCSSSCKNIPSFLRCLKFQFLYRFPTCLQKRRIGLLIQNPGRKNVTSTVFAKCNCIQTVMNLGSQCPLEASA